LLEYFYDFEAHAFLMENGKGFEEMKNGQAFLNIRDDSKKASLAGSSESQSMPKLETLCEPPAMKPISSNPSLNYTIPGWET